MLMIINTIQVIANTTDEVRAQLEKQAKCTLSNWGKENSLEANPSKFQVILSNDR